MFLIKKIFPALLFLPACGPAKKDKQLPAENILVAFSRMAADKGYDTAFFLADQRLEQLSSQSDSLFSFISYNHSFYDTAFKLRNWQHAKRYLQNIINKQDKMIVDSPALVTKAYYYWAETHQRHISANYNDTALHYFEKAISLNNNKNFLDTSDTRYANRCLGIYYNKLGDLKKTMLYYDREKSLFNGSSTGKSIIGNAINSSIALREMGKTDEAIRSALDAVAAKNVTADRTANAWTELSASQLEKGMIADAEKSVTYALVILDTLFVITEARDEILKLKGAAMYQKGKIQRIRNNYPSAIADIREAINRYGQANAGKSPSREIGKAFIETGNIYIQLKMDDSALFYFHQALVSVIPSIPADINALPARSSIYSENTIMDALDAKAGVLQKIYEKNKNPDLLAQSVICYELAFETDNKLMQSFSYDESLARQTRKSKIRSEKAIAACYELFSITKDAAWADKAFAMAEKSKSVVLQESVKRNLAANSAVQQDSNWLNTRFFQQEVNLYEKGLANAGDADSESMVLFKRQLAAAENNLLMANTALLNSNSAYREALIKTDSLSIPQLKNKLLTQRTALIEFFAGDSNTYIFFLTKNAPPLFIKANDTLSNSISQFLQFFTDKNKINNDPQAYQAAAYRLYQQAGLSAVTKEEISKLIIIPDGRLNFVPFDALVTGIKTEQNPQLFSYLLYQKQISYGYSAATLLKQSTNSSITSSAGIAFFAPVFSNNERGKAPLLHTLEEAEAIKSERSSGKYFIKDQATIGHFRNNMAGAGIIHIASHASADTSGSLQPMIEFYDSSLTLNEIYALHINPRLVVLSACETGIGKIDKSEGAMSLARGFYYAGAQNIITSLWNADDKSTAGIFSIFYADIKNNDYSRALYQSKLDYIKNATVSTASPYYWAGFVHIGYSQEKKQGLHLTLWLIISSSLTILIATLYFMRKRK